MGDIPQCSKIDIYPANATKFFESGIKEKLQPFVNMLLEKYFSGQVVIMNDKNAEYIVGLTAKDKLDTDIDTVVNSIIESVEVEVKVEIEKIKIPMGKKNSTKVVKKKGNNWVTGF